MSERLAQALDAIGKVLIDADTQEDRCRLLLDALSIFICMSVNRDRALADKFIDAFADDLRSQVRTMILVEATTGAEQ